MAPRGAHAAMCAAARAQGEGGSRRQRRRSGSPAARIMHDEPLGMGDGTARGRFEASSAGQLPGSARR